MDGLIHNLLVGKRVMMASKDGIYLNLHLDDGHIIKIGWRDANGELIKAEPGLIASDVKIVLPSPGAIFGEVGM